MSAEWDQPEGGVLFLDDDAEFTDFLQGWAEESQTEAIATTQPKALHEGLLTGSIKTVVSDLRMPGVDAIRLLEETRYRHPNVRLIVLSGYEPNAEERPRLLAIGAEIRRKSEMGALLEELGELPPPAETLKIVDYRARISALEERNRSLQAQIEDAADVQRQWTSVIADRLKRMPDGDKAIIYFRDEAFSVAELIDDLERVTPRGRQFLRLWASAFKRFLR